ncbi:hypothetical protein [Micromonospora sp. WMMD980]|uniref:hypothetical protein n=1 Tax=Micromonospora sp. WMMD980 TaxID=3016088 RepID=UPI0024165CC3|nr:hypothetical protein [Micromonospora sp. WMMD980]MDG4800752.1 hypothetical protein [Micromonospora sp. WMMD980]
MVVFAVTAVVWAVVPAWPGRAPHPLPVVVGAVNGPGSATAGALRIATPGRP